MPEGSKTDVTEIGGLEWERVPATPESTLLDPGKPGSHNSGVAFKSRKQNGDIRMMVLHLV